MAAFGAVHPGTAFSLNDAPAGRVGVAGVVTFVEPPVNAAAHEVSTAGGTRGRRHAGAPQRLGAEQVLMPNGR